VIEAMNKIKTKTRLPFKMIFTGKTEDPRNPEYFPAARPSHRLPQRQRMGTG
jgi:hypothetical protein